MNFLLIDVGYDCEELNEPLGIDVLASYLQEYLPVMNTSTYCANIDTEDYSSLFNRTKPTIIGVSTHINTWKRMDYVYEKYCEYCEEEKQEVIIVVGGILATYESQSIIEKYKNTVCVVGAGEETLLTILRVAYSMGKIDYCNLVQRLRSMNCLNLVMKCGSQLFFSERSLDIIPDGNLCPKHYYLEKIIQKNGIVRIEGSRGCPWNKCSFCVLKWKYAGKGWEPYSIEKVISEIIDLSNRGAKTIYFTDEEFLAGDDKRIFDIIDRLSALKKKKIINCEMEFVASTSARALLGGYDIPKQSIKRLLTNMRNVGFRSLFIGIESGSNTQLARLKKGSNANQNEEALRLLKDCDIEPDIGYILFDPMVTIDELKESLAFLEKNELNHQISRFAKRLRIVPNTDFEKSSDINFTYYDIDAVEQNYTFNDKRVDIVYNIYSKWEKQHLKDAHAMQGEIRAMKSSKVRDEKIVELQKLRNQEFMMLKYLVNIADEKPWLLEESYESVCKQIESKLYREV